MRGNQGRAARGDFNYAHVYTFAQELRKSNLRKADKELLAAFSARVFKRRMIYFELDNFTAMCLGLQEGKHAAQVHDSCFKKLPSYLCTDSEKFSAPLGQNFFNEIHYLP